MSSFNKWFCFFNELEGLFNCFNDKTYAIIKGDSLSLYAYSNVGKRIYSDIDVLVPREELSQFECDLSNYYFRCLETSRADRVLMMTSSHQVAPWRLNIIPWGNVIIDLNFDIFWGEYTGKRISIKEFLADTVDIEMYGVKVKTLPLLKTMVQVVLHHYKEMNSIYHLVRHKCIDINKFKDIYYLLKNNMEEISLDSLYAISTEYEIIPYVYYMLYWTKQIFSDTDIELYVDAFKCEDGIKLLENYGLAENEQKTWRVDFFTRLESDNIFELIKDDLTTADFEKIARNRRIFS